MAHGTYPRLLPLSDNVRTQIRSSIHINSLVDVVVGLVENSLDAGADIIEVRTDLRKGFCSVVDNGCGIHKDEFLETGGVAKLHHTSKINSKNSYRRYGRFLATLAGASIFSITSKSNLDSFACTVILDSCGRIGTVLDKEDDEHEIGNSGTKVLVHDLFGKFPVRSKHRSARFQIAGEVERDFSELKKKVVALLLASSHSFRIDIRDDTGKQRYTHQPVSLVPSTREKSIDLCRTCSILFRAGFIANFDTSTWKLASVRTGQITIRAAISLEPAPSKSAQFISFGQVPVCTRNAGILYDTINFYFMNSSFARPCFIQQPERRSKDCAFIHPVQRGTGYSTGHSRGVNKWPSFDIRFDTSHDYSHDVFDSERGFLDTNPTSTLLITLLKSLLVEFIRAHGFQTDNHSNLEVKSQRSTVRKKCDVRNQYSRPITYISPFDNWSRIKYGRGLPPDDILSGLPFHCDRHSGNKEPKTRVSDDAKSSDSNYLDAQPDLGITDEIPIKWIDPGTGQVQLIDGRTGFTLSNVLTTSVHECFRASLPSQTVLRRYSDPDGCFSQPKNDGATSNLQIQPTRTIIGCIDAEGNRRRKDCGGVESKSNLFDRAKLDVGATDVRIGKTGLSVANAIAQVDRKYILASIPGNKRLPKGEVEKEQLLVLIDQHAADERIKVEELLRELVQGQPNVLATPQVFEITEAEGKLFEKQREQFSKWKVIYRVGRSHRSLQVTALPAPITERCRHEPRLLIEILREEVWREKRTLRHVDEHDQVDDWTMVWIHWPPGVMEMVNSRACRSSIMFNDLLTVAQGQELIERLGSCRLPFQCAHGRPSMVAIGELDTWTGEDDWWAKDRNSFGNGWRSWQQIG